MAYFVERFDESTRQTFSIVGVFFQLFAGASVLYGLGLMVASTCGFPIIWSIVASGALVLMYCMMGGLWAVVVADFLQAMILMPFCLALVGASLLRLGRTAWPLPLASSTDGIPASARAIQLGVRCVLDADDDRGLEHGRDGAAILQRGQ